jgi:hypothetical protein
MQLGKTKWKLYFNELTLCQFQFKTKTIGCGATDQEEAELFQFQHVLCNEQRVKYILALETCLNPLT